MIAKTEQPPEPRDAAHGQPFIGILRPGETLEDGRYIIDGRIGSGKYGEVYRATDRDLLAYDGADGPSGDAQIAVKMLHPKLHRNTEARRRFLREGDLQARGFLGAHRNIVEVIRDPGSHRLTGSESDRPVNIPYLIMEYVEHITLRHYLRQSGGAIPRDAVFAAIVRQLGNALGWIASRPQPIVHRDLAAHNIMLRTEDRGSRTVLRSPDPNFVQLSDFGLAYIIGATDITKDVANSGGGRRRRVRIAANLNYASPEILQGFDPTPQDDVYAFSMLIYEMLTGHLPYAHGELETWEDFRAFRDQVEREMIMFDDDDDVPIAIQDSVIEGLAKRRQDRHQTAQGLAQAMLAELDPTAPEPAAPGTTATSTQTFTVPPIGFETPNTSPLQEGDAGRDTGRSIRRRIQRLRKS